MPPVSKTHRSSLLHLHISIVLELLNVTYNTYVYIPIVGLIVQNSIILLGGNNVSTE